MTNLWPWITVAGLGALHGLNPATGWMFAAAWGGHARGGSQVKRALLPLGIGHVAAIAVAVLAFAQGTTMDRALVQSLAGVRLVGAASYRMLRGVRQHISMRTRAGQAGIALWSFLMATAHGAGLMLIPALVPLCASDNPAREIAASGSLALALAAVGVHMAAMLTTTAVMATGLCRGLATHACLLNGSALRKAWTATLAITGALLLAL